MFKTVAAIMMYIALLACLTVCLSAPVDDSRWAKYKEEYGKVYTEEEDAVRYEIWKQNTDGIEQHNSAYESTYEQGVNEYTDMTHEEFRQIYRPCEFPEGILNGSIPTGGQEFVPPNEPIPNTINWVTRGYVTAVKNQGACGSCYSFSATGGLEGQWFRKYGKLISLSEQQIVDCSGRYGNLGCRGGWYQWSWNYLRAAGGSQTEASYPYQTRQYTCRFNRAYVSATVSSFVDLRAGDENALAQALATVGPVAVALDASHPSFRSYKRGVYYERACSSSRLDHAVLAVGYGREGGRDYWLIKNSWGNWFGDRGYIKIIRNYYNHCGVATKPSYPVV